MIKTNKIDKDVMENMKEFFEKENIPIHTDALFKKKTINLEKYSELIPPRYTSIIRVF